MKILVLGDIHGRIIWKDIIEAEQPDQVIFLGDYATSHERISDVQQIEQLEKILDYKEQFPNTILLRGNHDLDALGYYWARCSPIPGAKIREKMLHTTEFGQRFLESTQWLYKIGDTIFAHAGVTNEWIECILRMSWFDYDAINSMEPSEKFAFTGDYFDCTGTDPKQSCTWIRPSTLVEHAIPGFNQVVGHTSTRGACFEWKMTNGKSLWCCDSLGYKSYLVIEDNKYIVKTLNENTNTETNSPD